jgi:hypothetical protein
VDLASKHGLLASATFEDLFVKRAILWGDFLRPGELLPCCSAQCLGRAGDSLKATGHVILFMRYFAEVTTFVNY